MKLFVSALLLASLASAQTKFTVKDAREEVPHFKHTYTTATELRGHVVFSMTAETTRHFECNYSSYKCGDENRRDYYARLKQADGRELEFDPLSVPERLIDRDLVPWVLIVSRDSVRADGEFMKTNPPEFIAEDGWHWTRKPHPHK